MKISQEDKRVVSVSAITLVALSTIVAAVGWLTRDSIAPLVVDHIFGLSNYFEKESNQRIASGYSKTFTFSKTLTGEEQSLYFYADPNQTVHVFINGQSLPSVARVEIDVDQGQWTAPDGKPYHVFSVNGGWRYSDITKKLSFENEQQPNIHQLTFRPVDFNERSLISVDVVVLVSNQSESNE